MPGRLRAWALDSEGSTRPAALIRIGLVFILWSRWAEIVASHRGLDPRRIPLALLFFGATLMMLAGWRTRAATLASGLLAGTLYQVTFPEEFKWGSHHAYFLFAATMLCALMPAGRSYSVDRWLQVRRGTGVLPERANLWGQRLLTLQVSVVYLGAVLIKANAGFLSGERMEQILMFSFFGSQYPQWAGFHAFCLTLAWSTIVLELALAFGLYVTRWQSWLIPAGILFHGLIYVLFRVETFTVTTLLCYLAFLPPDSIHKWLDDVQSS